MQAPTYINPGPSNLLKEFPEALDIVRENLRTTQDSLDNLKIEYKGKWKDIHRRGGNPLEIHLIKYSHGIQEKRLRQKHSIYDRYIRIAEFGRKPKGKNEITDAEILTAKAVPITDIHGDNFSNAGFSKCPFHMERTASFKVYKDNRYHCFGCQANGDSIDYIVRLHQIDFLEAVRFLLKL